MLENSVCWSLTFFLEILGGERETHSEVGEDEIWTSKLNNNLSQKDATNEFTMHQLRLVPYTKIT